MGLGWGAGLFRVRGFTQDDGHIFCLPSQISSEIRGVLDLVEEVLTAFDFTDLEVSLRSLLRPSSPCPRSPS